MLGEGQSTASSQKSSPSDSEVHSGKRERSSYSSFSDTGSCKDDRVKHLDEQSNHSDVHLGDASGSDIASQPTHSDCISESSLSDNNSGVGAEDLDYLADDTNDDCSESDRDELGNCLPQKRVRANALTPSTLRSAPKQQRHSSRSITAWARNAKEPTVPSERDRTVQRRYTGHLAPPSDAVPQPRDALYVLESTRIDSRDLVLTLRLENFRQHLLVVKSDGFNRAAPYPLLLLYSSSSSRFPFHPE